MKGSHTHNNRNLCNIYSSHDNSVLRSASFHGTGDALSLANDWSDNELDYHYENNQVPPPSSPQIEVNMHLIMLKNI